MKITDKKFFAIAIGAALSLASCSKQLTSIGHINKLDNTQALVVKQNAPAQKPTTNQAAIKSTSVQPATIASNEPVTKAEKKLALRKSYAKKMHSALALVKTLPKAAENTMTKQATAISKIADNNKVSSYNKTKHTEGWLGFAIACLIIGIIFGVLGFADLGAIFWTIGVIVLVIALVFFILWIAAGAA